jgi:hypothetical protein
MKSEEGYKVLVEHYPNVVELGLILGDAEAIVGQFGLTVCINLPAKRMNPAGITNSTEALGFDYEEYRKNFVHNDKLPIIKFSPTGLTVDVGWLEPALLSYEHFKGFSFKNKLFI